MTPTDRERAREIVENWFGEEQDGDFAWCKIDGSNLADNIEAALASVRAETVEQLDAAEMSLRTYDTGGTSEYWLRYAAALTKTGDSDVR